MSEFKKPEDFRDRVGTISDEGTRTFVYPRKPRGFYTRMRQYLSYLLLAILFGLPFIKISGNPFLQVDIIARKFIIFGRPFWTADFHLFVLATISTIVFIILFSVIYGRIFCGWICPQTIFMEMVFRRIEYWIDGDRNQQIKLANKEWDGEKIRKRTLKFIIFFLISFLIANSFLMYIIGYEEVFSLYTENVAEKWGAIISLIIFTGVFFFVFWWFREQACTVVCPYGRLQGVLLDKNSLVVAYDRVRGEGENGRAKFRKNQDREADGIGDCIDCNQCVVVCPTNIDIRNGTQLDCVNCTACMDACDEVMIKIGKEPKLVGYFSEAQIEKNDHEKKTFYTTRVKAYSVFLTLLLAFAGFVFSLRTDVEAIILRTRGQLFERLENDTVSNLYNYTVVNKTNDTIHFNISLQEKPHTVQLIGVDKNTLYPGGQAEGLFKLKVPLQYLDSRSTKIKIQVANDAGQILDVMKSTFLGPKKKNKK